MNECNYFLAAYIDKIAKKPTIDKELVCYHVSVNFLVLNTPGPGAAPCI